MSGVKAGARFAHPLRFEDLQPGKPHIWRTLGYRRVLWEPGRVVLEWDAPEEYAFPGRGGYIVQGGMVTALLDAAMGSAAWTTLDLEEGFLTADIRVEFHSATRPGRLRAEGSVVRRTRRIVFCEGSLFDAAGELLAASRCTQIVSSAAAVSDTVSDTEVK